MLPRQFADNRIYDISREIKRITKEDGITQKTLAQAIGTTCDCIGFWEHGRSEPSITEIIALAKYFGVTTDYLLGIADSY